jgi:tetratricopeptide (TPR) repeat protein
VIEQLLNADRLLMVDQVEKAEAAYQRISDLDPANAIAVVGLARCALALGDDRRAHELASKALQIDPEDDKARRMEARLAEILTTRGETVSRPASAATPAPRRMRPLVAGGLDVTAAAPAAAAATTPAAPADANPRAPRRRGILARLMGR